MASMACAVQPACCVGGRSAKAGRPAGQQVRNAWIRTAQLQSCRARAAGSLGAPANQNPPRKGSGACRLAPCARARRDLSRLRHAVQVAALRTPAARRLGRQAVQVQAAAAAETAQARIASDIRWAALHLHCGRRQWALHVWVPACHSSWVLACLPAPSRCRRSLATLCRSRAIGGFATAMVL